MYRVIKMSGKFMALKIDSIEDDTENIEDFLASGDTVILCNDLDDLNYHLDIDLEDVEEVD